MAADLRSEGGISVLLQFPRRLVGYSPTAVTAAFRQVEAEYAAELARVRREIELAQETTKELTQRLLGLENQFKDTETRMQTEMLVTLRAQGQGQQILQQSALRHDEQRNRIVAQIEEREAVLNEIRRLRQALLGDLVRVVQRYQETLGAGNRVAVTTPLLSPGTPPTNAKSSGDNA